MTHTDFAKFSEELTRTAESFGAEMTPQRIATYFEDLADLSLEAVLGALQYSRRTLTFFPKIAELRRYAEGSVDDRAELAWRTVVDLVKFEGAYPSLYTQDGAIGYAIECLGGWLTVCAKFSSAGPEMIANYEKHFKNSYKLGALRNEEPRYLAGETETGNRSLGVWKKPTVEQAVCLVRPGYVVKAIMPFSVADGRLSDEARKALETGGNDLRRYVPLPPRPVKALEPAPDAELATPEEVAELKARIRLLAPSSRSSNVVSIADARESRGE